MHVAGGSVETRRRLPAFGVAYRQRQQQQKPAVYYSRPDMYFGCGWAGGCEWLASHPGQPARRPPRPASHSRGWPGGSAPPAEARKLQAPPLVPPQPPPPREPPSQHPTPHPFLAGVGAELQPGRVGGGVVCGVAPGSAQGWLLRPGSGWLRVSATLGGSRGGSWGGGGGRGRLLFRHIPLRAPQPFSRAPHQVPIWKPVQPPRRACSPVRLRAARHARCCRAPARIQLLFPTSSDASPCRGWKPAVHTSLS